MAKKKAKATKAKPKNPPAIAAAVSEPVPVRISIAGVALPHVVIVKIGQAVLWIAQDNGGPWIITFEGSSPFSQSTYRVPKGGSVSSGPAKGPVGIYRYSVSNAKGQITDDGAEVVVE